MPTSTIAAYGVALLCAAGAFSVLVIYTKKLRCMGAVLESFGRPFLFYDERDRLQLMSRGLVFFDPAGHKAVGRPPAKPIGPGAMTGEVIIDSNRYRYVSKLLEYKPGVAGTLVLLEYVGSASAR